MLRSEKDQRARDFFLSVGVAVACTLISIAVRSSLGPTTAAMTFLLGVTVVSTTCARGPAILNCILSVGFFYYFCVPPYGSFLVMEYSFVTTMAVMMFVALIITGLNDRVRRQSEAARKAEVAVETERMRNTLLSAVSHDLKNPLVSIYGAATSILDQGDRLSAPTRRALLSDIAEGAGELNRRLTNLLEMTRLDAGFELKKDWQSIEEIASNVLARLEPTLRGRHVTLSIPPDFPLIHVDEVLLEHVFVNLLENTSKYTPDSSPVRIVVAGDAVRVKISVCDSGPGFPPGSEERVFERFYRANPAVSKGVGLGLAISRAIVKAHGGEIYAENSSEGGAAIHVELPTGGPLPVMETLPE
jgi:K+-sensing histidine kinase KdpD